MNTSVQFAELKHLAWLVQNDYHIGRNIMEKKILSKQILVITLNKEVVGWLRFSLFWDMIPFILLHPYISLRKHKSYHLVYTNHNIRPLLHWH